MDKEKLLKIDWSDLLKKSNTPEAKKKRSEEKKLEFEKSLLLLHSNNDEAKKICRIFHNQYEKNEILVENGEVLCMSDYYPKLFDAKIPQPKTHIVEIDLSIFFILVMCYDYNYDWFLPYKEEALVKLKLQLQDIDIYFPKGFFFKTGTRSLKHASVETLMFFKNLEEFLLKISGICEGVFANFDNDRYSSNQFIFREILELDYKVIRNEQMPLINEYRIFYQNGKIQFTKPYYSFKQFMALAKDEECHQGKIKKDFIEMYKSVVKINKQDIKEINKIVKQISSIYQKGAIDVLQDKNGKWWFVDIQPQSMSDGFENLQGKINRIKSFFYRFKWFALWRLKKQKTNYAL